MVDRDTGQLIIQQLISAAVCEGGYASESALAKGMGIGANKLNRWKNGLYPVSPEGITLATMLLSRGRGPVIKEALDRRASLVNVLNEMKIAREWAKNALSKKASDNLGEPLTELIDLFELALEKRSDKASRDD